MRFLFCRSYDESVEQLNSNGSNDYDSALTVHTLIKSKGVVFLAKWAVMASLTYVRTLRCCCRQVSITLSSVSTKRLLFSLWVPKLSFRQITACRRLRSAVLFVDSTPSVSSNVHSQSRWACSSRHMPSTCVPCPRSSKAFTRSRTGERTYLSCAREMVPSRHLAHWRNSSLTSFIRSWLSRLA